MLFRRNERRWKPATLRLCYAGIKFYFQTVLDRRWRLFSILHAEDQQTLLVLLTQHEVIRILSCVKTFHNYVFFSLVYACGLHLGEALALTVDDVDAQAILLVPALGKGCKSGWAVKTTMNRASVQRAFLRARTAAAVTRALVSTHALRHSYAKHLLALEQMTEVFRRRFIWLLVEKKLLSEDFARNLLY